MIGGYGSDGSSTKAVVERSLRGREKEIKKEEKEKELAKQKKKPV